MNIEELRKKSCEVWSSANRKALHEAYFNTPLTTAAAAGASSGGSSRQPGDIQFVVNTTEYDDFRFEFTSTGEPIEFSIDWGDGTTHDDTGGGGFYAEEHTYAEVGSYTVRVSFDDPLKVLELDFPGTIDGISAGLTSIIGLQNLQNLVDFRAEYNYFESIDFSGLTNLTYVDVSDCDLVDSSVSSLTEVILTGCTALEELRLDDSDFSGGIPNLRGLENLFWLDLDQCGITGFVDLSYFPSLRGFDLSGNTGLTSVTISRSQSLGDGEEVLLDGCALTQESVDFILVELSNNGITNGYVDLRDGTNAVPSGTGIAAKAILESNGWTVNTEV
jgi:hypothetical protein